MKTCKKNLYRLLSLALCLALCMLPFSTAFAAGTVTGVKLTLDKTTLTASTEAQTVTVSIDLTISGDTTVVARGAQYKLTLPEDWTVVGHTFPDDADINKANTTSGMWAFLDGEDSVPISSIGTLVLGVPANTAAGTYDISFTDIKVNDADNESLIADATATATVTVKAPVAVEGYGVELTSNVTEIAEGGDISVYLDVTNDDVSTFNAFYAVLDYTNATYAGEDTVDDFGVDDSTDGKLVISKVGEDVSLSDSHELTLAFTAGDAGDEAAFSLSSAPVDIAANAQQDAPDATILTDASNPLTVTVLETYDVKITLGANMTASGSLTQTGLTGAMTDVTVIPAEGYELTAPTISPANAGISAAANADGSYTISGTPVDNVTVAFADATPITYDVTITLGENMTASGSLEQTGLIGAMTDVTVIPDDGYQLTAPTISPANAGISAAANADGSYTISGTPTEDVTVVFEDATLISAVEPTVEVSAASYFTGYTLITATIDTDGYVPTYNGAAMFTVEGYEPGTYYYVVAGDYDATQLGYATGSATNIARSADVNETGKVDINDAQYVYNLYNGTMTASTAQRLLLADVNRDKTVTTQDCTAVIALIP